ncbi:MAG: protein kinase [bacterium]
MKLKKIAHYKIQDKLGEGGMGVVYKAQDTKLNRTVAIKFLPIDRLGGKEEKARFVREARASAALNHPNIATVYAIEEEEGQTYIVMEYIDGESLKDKIHSGPLKLKKVLDIAAQVALGLQAAHEEGIIHRDIKSTNIMVTSKSQVKIMDFGLAKLSGGSLITKQGTTLGTIAYMSPEQAQGEDVDMRTDIWALGVVIYEMVTGQLPFQGDYDQALIYSILNEDPEPLSALRSRVPLELERIVEKCLAKDQNARYQNAIELPVDLKAIDVSSTGSTSKISTATATSFSRMSTMTPTTEVKPSRFKKMIRWTFALIFLTAAGFSAWKFWLSPSLSPVRRVAIETESSLNFSGSSAVIISPDGKTIVYSSQADGNSHLFLRAMDKFQATPIQGTDGANSLFFSPDGQWIGFYADGKVKKASLFGGVPTTLLETEFFFGASWTNQDSITFATRDSHGNSVLAKLSANGGAPTVLSQSQNRTAAKIISWPQVISGGKAILFTTLPEKSRNPDEGSAEILDLQSGERRTVLQGGVHARYSPTGHIVAAGSGGLLAAPFDPSKLEVTGPTVQVLEGILLTSGYIPNYAFSNDGSLVYVSAGKAAIEQSVVSVDRQGNSATIVSRHADFSWPRVSPDGRRVALTMDGKIWLMDMDSGDLVQLPTLGNCDRALWSPDGKEVTFASDRNGAWNLYKQSVENLNARATQLTEGEQQKWPTSWSADGTALAYHQADPDSGLDIWVLETGESNKAHPFLTTAANEQQAVFSPDGKWLAYTSDQSGRNEIYLQTYLDKSSPVQISQDGGAWPMWRPDGGELYFLSGNTVMAVAISTTPQVVVGSPAALFETNARGADIAISPQSGRFVAIEESLPGDIGRLNLVLNWFEELNRQVPSGKKLFGLLDF